MRGPGGLSAAGAVPSGGNYIYLESPAGELELGSPTWNWQLETLFIAE